MPKNTIVDIKSRMIIDSRGNPTVEADVCLSSGHMGRASVPSGASTGDKEALELRDKAKAWHGKGVNLAIQNIETHIKPQLIGLQSSNIEKIDNLLLDLDGTDNKSRLGANATLAVSLAAVQAEANSQKEPLFQYIYNRTKESDSLSNVPFTLPIPMMNILNGGSHADNNVDIQEFMIMPTGFSNYSTALRAGVEIFHSLKKLLKKENLSTSIGDEGGFAPNLSSNEHAIEIILESIDSAGYKAGNNVFLALDVAASEFYDYKSQCYNLDSKQVNTAQLIDYYKMLIQKYPVVSIEDGLDQNDWDGWKLLTQRLGGAVQIVGDDLTVTNPILLQKSIDLQAMNAILIKLNQIGTFTETVDAIKLAQNNSFGTIISHRSGETENTFIADLSVAVQAGQIKTGSLCRTDRTAKYNELLRIEEYLGDNAMYANLNYLGCENIKL
tara:strand:- start:2784 stop:4106 length:1323 start_codon:yes stop_codon:yes gene_type:complete